MWEEEWMKKEKGGVGCRQKIEGRNKEIRHYVKELKAVCAEKRTLTSKPSETGKIT